LVSRSVATGSSTHFTKLAQGTVKFRRRQRRPKHAVNAMLRNIFQKLEDEKLSELAIGDLNGIRESVKS